MSNDRAYRICKATEWTPVPKPPARSWVLLTSRAKITWLPVGWYPSQEEAYLALPPPRHVVTAESVRAFRPSWGKRARAWLKQRTAK